MTREAGDSVVRRPTLQVKEVFQRADDTATKVDFDVSPFNRN